MHHIKLAVCLLQVSIVLLVRTSVGLKKVVVSFGLNS